MRKRILAVIFACCILFTPHAVAAAGDEYPSGGDNCNSVDVVEPGVLQGQLDVSTDSDAFRLDVERGDTISFRLHSETRGVQIYTDGQFYDTSVNVINSTNSITLKGNGYYQSYVLTGGEEGVVTVRAQKSGIACFWVNPNFEYMEDTDLPADWRVTAAVNAAPPPEFTPASEALQERVKKLESKVSTLQQRVNEKKQTIRELRALLEQKNKTISDLRSQSPQTKQENVTIDVTVAPSGERENFVEGGQAIVRVDAENVAVEQASVEYNDGVYRFDSSGQVAIPLASTGTQEMTLSYGDTRKRVSIEVLPREAQSQQETQTQRASETSSAEGPGFGLIAAATALFCGVSLLRRYR